jgi:hypothetical protein
MVRKFNLGKLNVSLVFRHKWDSKDGMRYNTIFRDYSIGLWYKRSFIVGSKNFNKPKHWSKNLVSDYMIGLDFIVCKGWITINYGGKILNLNKKL